MFECGAKSLLLNIRLFVLAPVANDCFPPIVLKNSKISQLHFSVRIHCRHGIDAEYLLEPLSASVVANAGLGPTPLGEFSEGCSMGQFFNRFLKNRSFSTQSALFRKSNGATVEGTQESIELYGHQMDTGSSRTEAYSIITRK